MGNGFSSGVSPWRLYNYCQMECKDGTHSLHGAWMAAVSNGNQDKNLKNATKTTKNIIKLSLATRKEAGDFSMRDKNMIKGKDVLVAT